MASSGKMRGGDTRRREKWIIRGGEGIEVRRGRELWRMGL